MYDPKLNYYPYTEYTDQHYLKVKMDRRIVFDTNYPYVDNSKKQIRKERFIKFLCYIIVFPVLRIRTGLKINGRSNLKKYKSVIKGGIISASNHVHMWDYLAVMRSVAPYRTHILSWDKNINGENGKLIRNTGGIPVPTDNVKASLKMINETKKMLEEGGWLHVSAEGSMWEYYAQVRPFKDGPAFFAFKSKRPILPIGFSFREVKGIFKLFKKRPFLTINIGEPIYIDDSLPKNEAVKDLTIRLHQAICKLCGFTDGKCLYEPIFNNSKRIDYYTTEYGVGYKGSW